MNYREEMKLESIELNIQLEETVNRIFTREIERLRKKCKLKKFTNAECKVILLNNKNFKRNGMSEETGGFYTYVSDNDGNIIEHRIVLPRDKTKLYLQRWDSNKSEVVIQRNVRKNNPIVKTIRHELAHAFVVDRYKKSCKVLGVNKDSSPIYLYHLAYFNGSIGTAYPAQVKMREMILNDDANVYKGILKLNYEEFKKQAINPTIKNLNDLVDSIGKYAVIEFTSYQEEPVVIEPKKCTIKLGSEYVNISKTNVKEAEEKFKQYFIEVQKLLKVS